MKLDELVCATAWEIVFTSGEATEKEKQKVRGMRAFYKMYVDRFSIVKVADSSAYSDEKILQPMCSKGGQIGWKNGYSCN